MLELWSEYGFYLWGITTALVLIALAWLAWNSFAAQPEPEAEAEPGGSGVAELEARVTALAEATPLMQATLGRTLQFFGLVRYADRRGAGFRARGSQCTRGRLRALQQRARRLERQAALGLDLVGQVAAQRGGTVGGDAGARAHGVGAESLEHPF
jgi:hypothetical protein